MRLAEFEEVEQLFVGLLVIGKLVVELVGGVVGSGLAMGGLQEELVFWFGVLLLGVASGDGLAVDLLCSEVGRGVGVAGRVSVLQSVVEGLRLTVLPVDLAV